MIYKYNDYELLYLIRTGDELALNILLTKYDNLIYKKIIDFKVYTYDQEDFYQEGQMALYKAIFDFNEEYNKSFTKFLEMILNRRFIRIRGHSYYKDKYYFLNESLQDKIPSLINEEVVTADYYFNKENFKFSKLEKIILEEYFIKNMSIKYINEKYGIEKKMIYNSISRIKAKIKK